MNILGSIYDSSKPPKPLNDAQLSEVFPQGSYASQASSMKAEMWLAFFFVPEVYFGNMP